MSAGARNQEPQAGAQTAEIRCLTVWGLEGQDQGVSRAGGGLLRPLGLPCRWPSSSTSSHHHSSGRVSVSRPLNKDTSGQSSPSTLTRLPLKHIISKEDHKSEGAGRGAVQHITKRLVWPVGRGEFGGGVQNKQTRQKDPKKPIGDQILKGFT